MVCLVVMSPSRNRALRHRIRGMNSYTRLISFILKNYQIFLHNDFYPVSFASYLMKIPPIKYGILLEKIMFNISIKYHICNGI